MVTQCIGTSSADQTSFSGPAAAACLGARQRQALSLAVLARGEPVGQLARRHGVSRQFCYRQAGKARDALDEAFAPTTDDKAVLFELPVTKHWIRQLVLAQVLIGHTSYRGVMEILDAVFDYRDISLGTIHNIAAEAVTGHVPLTMGRTCRTFAWGPTTKSSRAASPCWSAPMSIRRIATC